MVTIVGIACWDTVLAAAKIPDRGDKLRVRPLVSAPGGDAANTAAHLAALDIPTTLVCRLGDDTAGASIRAACGSFASLRVVCQPVSHTTQATVLVEPDGERTILYVEPDEGMKPAADARALRAVREAWGAWIDLDVPADRLALLRAAVRGGCPAAHLEAVVSGGGCVDWTVGSLAESTFPDRDLLHQAKVRACVMTDGARGYHVWEPERSWTRANAVRCDDVVDSTGVGDAFLGGFLGGLFRWGDPRRAATLGAQISSGCAAHVGAWPRGYATAAPTAESSPL